jgi:MSHA biogenesis protein MshQ
MKDLLANRCGILVFAIFILTCNYSYAVDIHHYEISHNEQGLICGTEMVVVKACNDQRCSSLSTQPVSVDLLADGVTIDSPTFMGSTIVNINQTVAETITFALNNASVTPTNSYVCNGGIGHSCDMVFNDTAFRFIYDSGSNQSSILPNQVSGKIFQKSLKLQAVQSISGVCNAFLNGEVAIKLSHENVQPKSSGLQFSVSGHPIANYLASFGASTSTNLTFINGVASIPQPIYHDAGKIRLHANYNGASGKVSGSSNAFWVTPDKLVAIAKAGDKQLNAKNATTLSSSPTHKAGEDFTLTVKAYNGASPAVVTQNYLPGQIQFKLDRIGPTSHNNIDSGDEGKFTYNSESILVSNTIAAVNIANFSFGISTYDNAQYSEVGLLKLKVKDLSYGDGTRQIEADTINIGRYDKYRQIR